jgi:hypothetical protein
MGFISDLLSAKNDYKAQGVQTQNADYMAKIQQILGQVGDYSEASRVAGQQNQLAETLRGQVAGQGPSLAQLQLQNATDRNTQQAAGMIASQRGLNPALAARQILTQQADINQQAANQSAQQRMQEQFGAEAQLGGLLGQQRQQAVAQTAGQNQLLDSLGSMQQAQNNLAVQQNLGVQGINAGVASGNQQGQNSITGGIINAIGGAGAKAAGKADGGEIEGQPVVEGDDERNDTVPALLSPGEVVIPRSLVDEENFDPKRIVEFVMKSKGLKMAEGGEVKKGPDLEQDKVRAFVEAFGAQKKEAQPQGYSRVLQSKQKLDKVRGDKP